MRHKILATAVAAVVLGASGIAPALAHEGSHGHGSHGSASASPVFGPSKGRAYSFTATLSGAEEVAVPGGPAVSDPDGKGTALIKVKGDRVTFALQWKGLAPTLGHIHQGAKGTTGGVKVPLFGSAMPSSAHSAAGQVSLTDPALAEQIRNNPSNFYVNLHSAEFPGGAVRGQLKAAKRNLNPLTIIKGGKLRALSNGEQEVPKNADSKVGDPDGHAVTFLRLDDADVDYAFAWINIQSPSLGHLHQGAFGVNGPVVLNFFDKPVPDGIFAVAGRLTGQDPAVVKRIKANPRNYYSNIHTPEFPDGAVRGQLFR
ncbi:CHRD domain-containing protein [Streptomyces sp. NPDC058548]|uniref:CHRD domain-containing protein n=1 Tax=unclassified Streptomyces TaxID=2593676 RepID=UPI00365DA9E5